MGMFNFNNIGAKIKGFAKWACWITIWLVWAASAIMFLVFIADEWMAYLCWIPLVGAAVLPFIIWISSWVLYGFGELVENATNNQNSAPIKQNAAPVTATAAKAAPQQEDSERIRNLQTLRAQGLITEEEYQQAMAKK